MTSTSSANDTQPWRQNKEKARQTKVFSICCWRITTQRQLNTDSSTSSSDTAQRANRERRNTRSIISTMSTIAPKRKLTDEPKNGTDLGKEEGAAAATTATETTLSSAKSDKKTKVIDGKETTITDTAATAPVKMNDEETKTRKEEEEDVAEETEDSKEDSKSGKEEKKASKADSADSDDDADDTKAKSCPFTDAEVKKLEDLLKEMFEAEKLEAQMTGCTITCPLTGMQECFCKCGPHLTCPEHCLNCMCHWNGDFSRIERAGLDPLLVKWIKWNSSY